jgi:hypothetical protein
MCLYHQENIEDIGMKFVADSRDYPGGTKVKENKISGWLESRPIIERGTSRTRRRLMTTPTASMCTKYTNVG